MSKGSDIVKEGPEVSIDVKPTVYVFLDEASRLMGCLLKTKQCSGRTLFEKNVVDPPLIILTYEVVERRTMRLRRHDGGAMDAWCVSLSAPASLNILVSVISSFHFSAMTILVRQDGNFHMFQMSESVRLPQLCLKYLSVSP